MNIEALWTLEDVAAHMRCTPRHIQNLVKAGLPHLKIGRLVRFDPKEVREYTAKRRTLTSERSVG
jgi:excisionase family DNA binding protein